MKGTRPLLLGCVTAALGLTAMQSCAHAAPRASGTEARRGSGCGTQPRERSDPAHSGRAVVRLVDMDRLLKAKDALAPTLDAPQATVRRLVDVRGLLKEPGLAPLAGQGPETAETR